MFRRLLSSLLIAVLVVGVPASALSESTMTAGEALFGNNTGAASLPDVPSDSGDVEDETYGDTDTASIHEYPTLQLGDRDGDDSAAYIVMLQNRLIALGFLKGSADGVYGEATETAVAQFQRMNGLERTGIADPATQEKVFSDMGSLTTPSPENPVVYGSEAIRVQSKLVEWGFLIGSVDGVLGKASSAAIIRFKEYLEANDMIIGPTPLPSPEPTPTPDPNGMPMVNDIPLETPTPEPAAFAADDEVDELLLAYIDGELPFDVYRQTVQNGDKSAEVRRVQTRLKQLNYLYADPDGAFGMNTARALMYFQKKHGLSENGVADEATQRALFSASAQRAEEYVFPYKIYVDISDQRVYVFRWDGSSYSIPDRAMICSTGKDNTPTPTGTYQAYAQLSGEWYYFKEFNCYAKWAYGIVGGILFHSVTYSASKKLNEGSVRNLGKKASHGCIRLSVDDAKWIYDNCPYGTTVVIQE